MVCFWHILPPLCAEKTQRCQWSLCHYLAQSYMRRLCRGGRIECWGHESVVQFFGFAVGMVAEGINGEDQDQGVIWKALEAGAERTPLLWMWDAFCIGRPALCPIDLRGSPPHSKSFSRLLFRKSGLLQLPHILAGFAAKFDWWTLRYCARHWHFDGWGWARCWILWQRYLSVACSVPLWLSALDHHCQLGLSFHGADGACFFGWLSGPVVRPRWGFLESCLPIPSHGEPSTWTLRRVHFFLWTIKVGISLPQF